MSEDDRKAELLWDLLAGILPIRISNTKAHSKEPENLQSTISSLLEEPIGQLLNNPNTDLISLRKVKNYAKRLSKNTESKNEHQVANIVYYAAVACALVFHHKRITKFSYSNLEKYFHRLGQEKWIPKYIQNLFARAYDYCRINKDHEQELGSGS